MEFALPVNRAYNRGGYHLGIRFDSISAMLIEVYGHAGGSTKCNISHCQDADTSQQWRVHKSKRFQATNIMSQQTFTRIFHAA